MKPSTYPVALLMAAGMAAGEQTNTPAGDSKPASSNVMGASYPRIDSENRVTFQLKAPDARSVRAQVYHGQYDMTKGADGVWSVITPPIIPGFH
jgi:1,4-alpha-glucan branching enzyme